MFRTLFGPSKASAKGASYAHFIYLSHELQAVRAKLNQLMLGDGSVALISGRSGIGKSFLLQLLASDLEGRRSSRRVVSLSCNFGFSGADLVRRVCEKLGAPHAASIAADEDHHLRRSLLDGVGKDRLTILLVDEAQNLDEGELDRFLRLTELHAGSHSKLRIVLTGRSDAEQAFARAARRHPRRVWRHRLQPLQRQEIAPFIAAWLRAKGRKRDNKLFPPEAVEGIARYSAGVPGLVIELCATALHLAAEGVRQPFAAEDIEEVADYLQLDLSEPSSDPAFNEDLVDDTDDPVEEESGTAVALPMPASRRPAPPPPEDDIVVLPFAPEPAKPERPRAQLPVRRPRPAGLEKVLPKQAPALSPASPQRARPKQPKRVVQLEAVDAPRPSRRFAMPEPEDAFVAGPRPAAMATRGRRRRAGWAGRAAALAVVAGMALLLLAAWQYMTDRSPLEVATAIFGLDAPAPGEADAGAAPAATDAPAGATGASPVAGRAATSVPVPSPVPDKAEPAPALAANDAAEMESVAREPPPLPAMRDMAAPEAKDSAGDNAAVAAKPTPDVAERAPEESPPPARSVETVRPSEPEEPARVAQGAPPVTEQPKQPAPAAEPTPVPEQPETGADRAMASAEPAGQAEAAKAANGGPATATASSPDQDVTATAPAKEEVAALPPAAAPTQPQAGQEPAAGDDAKAASPPVAAPADPIPGLLAQARRQIEDYALTTPKGDNAMETYRQVLQIAPGNPQALQGIREVARTYLRLADAAERSGDVTHMQRYRDKAAELAPDDPIVAAALRRVRTQQQARAEPPQTAPQPAGQPVAAAPGAAPEGDAGRLAAASGIIKLLQERFARKDSTSAPAAPSQPGNAVPGGQDSRQAASPAPPPRNVNRRPTGPMALAAFDQPGGIEQAIAQGRDVNTRFADGRTPLIVAAARGETDRVKLLLANGAEPDAATGDAATALMYAAWNGDPDATEALLRHGANPNKRNVDGKTALMAAATNGHVGTAETLLRHGATVDTRANNGWTALMYAAWTGNAEVAGTLLEHKADPAIANDAGDTAADLAAQRGYTAIVNMLHARRMAGGRKVGSVRTANRGAASRGDAVAR